MNYKVIQFARTWLMTRKGYMTRRWVKCSTTYFDKKSEALKFIRCMLQSSSEKYTLVKLDKGGKNHGKR